MESSFKILEKDIEKFFAQVEHLFGFMHMLFAEPVPTLRR